FCLSCSLPRKTDMERKIEIVQFSSRTRQLFVRLLALVKWASNAGKVEKCAVCMLDYSTLHQTLSKWAYTTRYYLELCT
uniref:Mediator of RNA polymerase II transcription subunit 14 n=1 Tax=Hucho hucho TaxID=62062 RepID=A0A4W5NYR8_9TELE